MTKTWNKDVFDEFEAHSYLFFGDDLILKMDPFLAYSWSNRTNLISYLLSLYHVIWLIMLLKQLINLNFWLEFIFLKRNKATSLFCYNFLNFDIYLRNRLFYFFLNFENLYFTITLFVEHRKKMIVLKERLLFHQLYVLKTYLTFPIVVGADVFPLMIHIIQFISCEFGIETNGVDVLKLLENICTRVIAVQRVKIYI